MSSESGESTDQNFRFVRNASHGVNKDNPNLNTDNPTELDCVLALLTPTIIDDLLDNINSYAQTQARCDSVRETARRYSVFKNFKPVDRAELYRFMAILIAMGLSPRSRIKDFWSNKTPHMFTPWYNQQMKRNRFESIYHTFLHAAGADSETKEKVEPFMNSIMLNCQEAFYPGRLFYLYYFL